MKNVLVIVFNNLKVDARVTRQINFLTNNYSVTACCFDANPTNAYEVYKIEKTKLSFFRKVISSIFLLSRLYSIAYKLVHNYGSHIASLRKRNFDLIIANDAETLPLAFKIATSNAKIYFDAHEYAPRQFEDRRYWRIFFQRFYTHICKIYIPKVSGMCTINHAIANAYEKNFGVKPIIITNATDYFERSPKLPVRYPIKLVHHGIFTISRSPELMIDLMKMLDDRFTLDLIYMIPEGASATTRQYFLEFKGKAAETGKINILPPVTNTEIVPFLNERYDLGIILIPPVNFNYENTLPNKLFECIQARLGVAVGPTPEIASITTKYAIGVISDEFTAAGLAAKLNVLTIDDVSEFKKNSTVAAKEMNAQYNRTLLLNDLKKIL